MIYILKSYCKIHDIYFVVGLSDSLYPYIMTNVNYDTDEKQKQRKKHLLGSCAFALYYITSTENNTLIL